MKRLEAGKAMHREVDDIQFDLASEPVRLVLPAYYSIVATPIFLAKYTISRAVRDTATANELILWSNP